MLSKPRFEEEHYRQAPGTESRKHEVQWRKQARRVTGALWGMTTAVTEKLLGMLPKVSS